MYSLHIIDKLSSTNNGGNAKEPSVSIDKTEEDKVSVENWNDLFIKKGGLRLLYDIMMSGEYLLKLIYIFCVWCTKKCFYSLVKKLFIINFLKKYT